MASDEEMSPENYKTRFTDFFQGRKCCDQMRQVWLNTADETAITLQTRAFPKRIRRDKRVDKYKSGVN